jgi:hypothetical protein
MCEAERAGDRDAVSAVDDVVAVRLLDGVDRRERLAGSGCFGDPSPAFLDVVGGRPDGGVEVARGLRRAGSRVQTVASARERGQRGRRAFEPERASDSAGVIAAAGARDVAGRVK